MKRNHSKYQAITFGRVKKNPVLTCEGTVIPIQDEMELRSVTIDNKLKFEGQIRKICRKESQQVAVLNRLKKILPFEPRLEKVIERALRFVTLDKSTTYETLLKQLNLLSPFNQRIVKMATGGHGVMTQFVNISFFCVPVHEDTTATGVYKAIHGYKVPTGIGELLHERSTNYSLRGKHILELPKVNTTTYGLKS